MPPSESAPLLPREGRSNHGSGNVKFNPLGSSKHLMFGSWINVLLVAAPISIVGMSAYSGWTDMQRITWAGAPLLVSPFLSSLSFPWPRWVQREDQCAREANFKLLGDATEQVSMKLGMSYSLSISHR